MLPQALHRHAVDADPLRLAGLEADAQRVPAVATLDLDLNPSCALAEAHDLALVASTARAPGATEVQRLEEVGLAGPVAPVDDREPGAEGDVRALVRAEVPHPDAANDHGPYTFSRIGMIRYRNPESSPASMSPGRSGLISFSTTSSAATDSRPSLRNSGLNPISNGSPANGTGIVCDASPTSGVCALTVSSPSAKRRRSGAFFCAMRLMRPTTDRSSSVAIRSSCSNASGSSWL